MKDLDARFPGVARWLASAPPPARVELLRGPAPALLFEGVQLASRFDPRAEAELQARFVPAGARAATVYGPGQGELVRVLLARAGLARLRVVLMNPSVTREVLARFPAEWLDDERVELVVPHELLELEAPFAAAPAELRLACDEAARLRDLVQLELATPFTRRHQRARAAELGARVAANAARGDGEIGAAFGTRAGAALCVAAAGPSLARHYDELRARAHELIAVDAALKPLLAAGVVPAWVVTLDAHEEGMRRVFAVELGPLAETTLVYFPGALPAVLDAWPGPRRRASSDGEPLFSSGSVLHPAVDLAVRLGARRVELFGADFALTGGKSHAAGCAWQHDWERGGGAAWVHDWRGARVPSLPNLVGYLRDFERYVARHPEVEFVARAGECAAIRGARLEEAARVA